MSWSCHCPGLVVRGVGVCPQRRQWREWAGRRRGRASPRVGALARNLRRMRVIMLGQRAGCTKQIWRGVRRMQIQKRIASMVVLVDRTPGASRLSMRHTTTVVRLSRTMNPSEGRFHRHVRATWSPCAASPDWSWSSGIQLAAIAHVTVVLVIKYSTPTFYARLTGLDAPDFCHPPK